MFVLDLKIHNAWIQNVHLARVISVKLWSLVNVLPPPLSKFWVIGFCPTSHFQNQHKLEGKYSLSSDYHVVLGVSLPSLQKFCECSLDVLDHGGGIVWYIGSGEIFGFQIIFQLARLERICGLWREVAGSGRPIMLIDGPRSSPALSKGRSSAHCRITSAIYTP